jgi:hypothetical protein
MTKLAENNPQGTANIADDRVLAPVFSIGMTVYYKSLSGRKGDDTSLKETKITKVGNKYVEITEKWVGRFYKDSLKHDAGEYSSRYQLYLNKEHYEIELEKQLIQRELRDYFQGYSKIDLSIEKLRQILSIVRS